MDGRHYRVKVMKTDGGDPPPSSQPVVEVLLHREELSDGFVVQPQSLRRGAGDERSYLGEASVNRYRDSAPRGFVPGETHLDLEYPFQGPSDPVISREVGPVGAILDPDGVALLALDVESDVGEPLENNTLLPPD